jgi:hypothetical protein
LVVKRMLVGDEIHSAKRGVTAHTTQRSLPPAASQTRQVPEASTKASQGQGTSGALLWLQDSRTCTGCACLAIARQQTSTLVNDQVCARNTELEDLGVRINET